MFWIPRLRAEGRGRHRRGRQRRGRQGWIHFKSETLYSFDRPFYLQPLLARNLRGTERQGMRLFSPSKLNPIKFLNPLISPMSVNRLLFKYNHSNWVNALKSPMSVNRLSFKNRDSNWVNALNPSIVVKKFSFKRK